MSSILKDVAIIGAGLGGCALALALTERDIPVTVYESRPEISPLIPSGVVLTPNGSKILDHLGVCSRIKDRCYIPTHRIFKNDDDETTKSSPAGEPNGFPNLRIWRGILLDEMKAMLKERSVLVRYNSKFNGILSDSQDGVSFRINAEEVHASLLVGSDGINSTLRQYIAPGVEPQYTGVLGILSHIKWDSVAWPYEGYDKNATIQSKPGAIFWIAEDPDGEEIMVGKQVQYPKQSKDDLSRLQADKEKIASFFLENYDEYGETARKIIDSICRRKEDLFIWAYMKMPEISRWYSETGRIILVGDGAHVLPPSSGQGVNQALEDAFSLAIMLPAIDKLQQGKRDDLLVDGLSHWQHMRQERIDAVFDWTNNTSNVSRLPEAERNKLIAEGKVKVAEGDDLSWLYSPGIEEKIDIWVKAHSR